MSTYVCDPIADMYACSNVLSWTIKNKETSISISKAVVVKVSSWFESVGSSKQLLSLCK